MKRLGTAVGLAGLVLAVGCGGNTSAGTGRTTDAGTGGSAAGGSGGSSGTGGSGAAGGTAGAGGTGCGAHAKSCNLPSDCVLAAASCCICSSPTLSDYVAVNKAHSAECPCQGPGCGCASRANPNLGATCTSGTCRGFDVTRVDALSACQSDADCTLRVGAQCCTGCVANDYNLVAIRTDAAPALEQMVCDPTGMMCPNCMPAMPANARAACVQGHCQVVIQ